MVDGGKSWSCVFLVEQCKAKEVSGVRATLRHAQVNGIGPGTYPTEGIGHGDHGGRNRAPSSICVLTGEGLGGRRRLGLRRVSESRACACAAVGQVGDDVLDESSSLVPFLPRQR